jgi:arabinose-5-phosphate isomerase
MTSEAESLPSMNIPVVPHTSTETHSEPRSLARWVLTPAASALLDLCHRLDLRFVKALERGDALAIALLENRGLRAEDFVFVHPGGTLGARSLRRLYSLMQALIV